MPALYQICEWISTKHHTTYSTALNILCLVSTLIYYHASTETTCKTSVGFKIAFELYFKLSEQLLQIFLSPREAL